MGFNDSLGTTVCEGLCERLGELVGDSLGTAEGDELGTRVGREESLGAFEKLGDADGATDSLGECGCVEGDVEGDCEGTIDRLGSIGGATE